MKTNDVIESKTTISSDKKTATFYRKHENGFYSREICKKKEGSDSEYFTSEYSAITKEIYDAYPELPSKQK